MNNAAATSLTVWRAAASIVVFLVLTASGGAFFLASLEGGVIANETAIIEVDADLREHSAIAATRFSVNASRTRVLEITNATYEEKLNGLSSQLDRIEQLIRGNGR